MCCVDFDLGSMHNVLTCKYGFRDGSAYFVAAVLALWTEVSSSAKITLMFVMKLHGYYILGLESVKLLEYGKFDFFRQISDGNG